MIVDNDQLLYVFGNGGARVLRRGRPEPFARQLIREAADTGACRSRPHPICGLDRVVETCGLSHIARQCHASPVREEIDIGCHAPYISVRHSHSTGPYRNRLSHQALKKTWAA